MLVLEKVVNPKLAFSSAQPFDSGSHTNGPSIWQYGLWSFQAGGTKLERFLHKNQYTQRKLLNFEFWINGELSKIGHHFSNKKNLN